MTLLTDHFLECQRQILLSQRFDNDEHPEFWEWIAWENIIGGEGDNFLVDTSDFPIRSGSKHELYEISNFEGFTEITEVTDEIRVGFARDVWSEALKELDGGSMPSSSFYPLTDSRDSSAGIGVLVWIYGQSGPHPENCGFFPSCDDFFQSLRERGFRDPDEVKNLSDEEVLQIYMAAIDRVSITAYWGNDDAFMHIDLRSPEWDRIQSGGEYETLSTSWYEGHTEQVVWKFNNGLVSIEGEDSGQCLVHAPLNVLEIDD